MVRNILLTSLSAVENDLPLSYYSLQKEFGFDYCDALTDAEAGIKAILAGYDIDEIIVIGGDGAFDEKDELGAVSLLQGSSLYAEDRREFSAYRMLRYRLAQYAGELTLEQKAEEELLPGELREKLTRFIQDYQERTDDLKNRKFNRLFDVLSQNDQSYESFRDALFDAFPELRDHPGPCIRWIKNYLYAALKDSSKLELLPVNEKTAIRLIPENIMADGERWADSMMALEKSIVKDCEEVNLYVSLNGDDAADTFVVINMLDIMVTMPESITRLKKIFTLRGSRREMTGIIRDDTEGFGVTELFHAIRSFLNYGKADMIARIWEKSGEYNESIAGMIYAMRHVDVGLSMCNIPEVESGILRLRRLFRDEKFLRDSRCYGMIFSVIAESIREDYGALLEGEGGIPFIELVKWAYRHQFYQQTLTLIESRTPGNLVGSGVFYYCGDEDLKERVTELFARQRLELKPHEYYKMDDIDHYFVKIYNRSGTRGLGGRDEDPQRVYASLRTNSVGNTEPSLITGLSACDSMETLQNLLYAYYHISDIRNKINHADASAMIERRLMVSDSDESSALLWMKDGIDYFIDSYEKAMTQVQNKKPKVVRISGDEVRVAAEYLKYERQKNEARSR